MRRALGFALILLLVATPALGQTATPSPSPTGATSGAAATLSALPTFSLSGSATATPAPTIAWPTLTPNPNTTPKPWIGVGELPMTPGGGFVPPNPPAFTSPDLPGVNTPNGFSAINDLNLSAFMVYLIDVGINFFRWLSINFPRLIIAARWFVIIMLVLYGIFWIWKGSKFAPPDADRDANPRSFFFRSFRMGGRYYYYKRGSRIKDDPDAPKQGKLL
jgi:hypothetical protein